MFDFIDDIKLKIRQDRERRNLQKSKDAEFKVLEDKKQYQLTKESLDNDIELEIRKAKIRKQQAISPPKPGTKAPEQKSAFGKFQDYATDFANRQPQGKSIVGDFGMGSGPPADKPDKPKHKVRRKRKKEKVKMVYVPMNTFGNNNIKPVWR